MIASIPARKSKTARLLLHGILLLNIGLGLSYILIWFVALQREMFWMADFSAFYTGGAIVRDGLGNRLYDQDLQRQYQQDILGGRSFKDGILYYNYPPHAVFPFAILSKFPREISFFLWTGIQVFILAWLVTSLRKITLGWERQERWLAISAVIALPSMMLNFMLGAFSLFTLACLLQYYLTIKKSQEEKTGFWLALGLFKPQPIVLPVAMILGARRWRAIGSASLVTLVMVLLSSIILGWHTWIDFLQQVLSTSGYFDTFGVFPKDMYNLKGILTFLLGNEQSTTINTISMLAFGISILFVIYLWSGQWEPEEPVFELRLAITTLTGILFSPHVNPQDGLLIVLPAILFYVYLRKNRSYLVPYSSFILLCPIVFLLWEFSLGVETGVHAPVVAMVVLLAWMLWMLRLRNRA